jgi:iron(III) transport system substrate-binding protein
MAERRPRVIALALVTLLLASGCGGTSTPPAQTGAGQAASGTPLPYADLIAKARQEGVVNFQIDSSRKIPDVDFARRVQEGMKALYGIDVKIQNDSSLAYQAAMAKSISEVQAKSPTTYDIMWQDTITSLPGVDAGIAAKISWTKLFPWIADKDLRHDALFPVPSAIFNLPAYNTKLVTGADIPKTWDDLLNPKFKGRMGATVYQEPWVPLTLKDAWGEEKVYSYLTKLAAQQPALGRFGELHQKLITGELSVFALDNYDWVEFDMKKGAPINFVDLEPVLVVTKVLVIPQGAPHSAAATLMAAWLLSDPGQKLLDEAYTASPVRTGTLTNQFLSKRKWVSPDTEFLRKDATRVKEAIDKIIVKR